MSGLYRHHNSPNWFYTDGTGHDWIQKSTGARSRRIAEMIRTRWDEERLLRKHGITTKNMPLKGISHE